MKPEPRREPPMTDRAETNARAIAVAGPFEPSTRSRATLSAEAIAGAGALIAAFLVMTGALLVHALR
jgi:hypothetical protein